MPASIKPIASDWSSYYSLLVSPLKLEESTPCSVYFAQGGTHLFDVLSLTPEYSLEMDFPRSIKSNTLDQAISITYIDRLHIKNMRNSHIHWLRLLISPQQRAQLFCTSATRGISAVIKQLCQLPILSLAPITHQSLGIKEWSSDCVTTSRGSWRCHVLILLWCLHW